MTPYLDYIRAVFDHHKLGLEWTCKKLGRGWSKQRLFAILNTAKNIYIDDFYEIKRLLDAHNFTLPDDYHRNISIEVSELNKQSAELVTQSIAVFHDGVFTAAEKADLLLTCKKIETRVNDLMKLISKGE